MEYIDTFQLQSVGSQATITLLKELDYETNNYYQFNITATVCNTNCTRDLGV